MPDENYSRLLDEYLDGLMDQEARQAFEVTISQEPHLRAEVACQRMVDESLMRQFTPPSCEALLARIRDGQLPTVGALRSRTYRLLGRQGLAAAALIALTVVGGWHIWGLFQGDGPVYPTRPLLTLAQVQQDIRDNSFDPDWVCKTDHEFAQTFRRRLGQNLLLGQVPGNFQGVGLSYYNSITPLTVVNLVRFDGHEVLVFIDRADRDRGHSLPADSDLHLFSRRVDDLILYELTPLDRPRVLEHFYRPEPSDPRLADP